jgi:hypothetical protein
MCAPALTRIGGMAVSNATPFRVHVALLDFHATIMAVSVAWQ